MTPLPRHRTPNKIPDEAIEVLIPFFPVMVYLPLVSSLLSKEIPYIVSQIYLLWASTILSEPPRLRAPWPSLIWVILQGAELHNVDFAVRRRKRGPTEQV